MQMWTCVQLLGFEREIKCDSRTDVAFYLSICLPQHYRFCLFFSSFFCFPCLSFRVRRWQMLRVMPAYLPACLAKLLHACLSLCFSPLSLISCCGPTYWDKLLLTLTSTAQLSLSPAAFLFSLVCHTCCCLLLPSPLSYQFFFLPDKLVTTALWRQPTCLHVSILILYFTCAAGVRAPLHSTGLLINAASILMEFQGLLCFYINMHCGYRVGSTARELCFCS